MEDVREQESGGDGRRVGRRGLLLGGLGAAVVGALGKVKPAAGGNAAGETVIPGDVLVGHFPASAVDSASVGIDLYKSTFRAYHSKNSFNPAAALQVKATIHGLEEDVDRAAAVLENTGGGPALRSYNFSALDATDVGSNPPSNELFRFGVTSTLAPIPLDPVTLQVLNFRVGDKPLAVRNLAGDDAASFEGNVECLNDVIVHGQLACSVRSTTCAAGSDRCTIIDADCTANSLVICVPTMDPGRDNVVVAVIPGDGSFEIVFNRNLRVALTLFYLLVLRAPVPVPN
jgi:hypothetical protein